MPHISADASWNETAQVGTRTLGFNQTSKAGSTDGMRETAQAAADPPEG